jgi:hypothetical protein
MKQGIGIDTKSIVVHGAAAAVNATNKMAAKQTNN